MQAFTGPILSLSMPISSFVRMFPTMERDIISAPVSAVSRMLRAKPVKCWAIPAIEVWSSVITHRQRKAAFL